MSRFILQLTSSPGQQQDRVYRVQTGDTVYLSKSCEMGTHCDLVLSCIDPAGDTVSLHVEGNHDKSGRVYEYDNGSFGELTSFSFVTTIAGPYTLSYKTPLGGANSEVTRITVLADPVITSDSMADHTRLSIDQIAVQTHLVKCCGPMSDWREVFEVTKQSGYNMVHLTPIQELGVSGSSYSLHSHLKLSASLGFGGGSYEQQLQEFGKRLRDIHSDTGLFFLTDLVWNHVSICNTDIDAHPDSYYNLHNTPNLIPAYLLDRSIAKFAAGLSDVSEVRDMGSFEERLRNSLCEVVPLLESMYRVDYLSSREDGDLGDLESVEKPSDVIFKLWRIDHRIKQANGGSINMNIFRGWLLRKGFASSDNLSEVVKSEIRFFNDVRIPQYVAQIIDNVVNAVIGTVKHRFVDPSGLNLEFGTVNLVDRYFHISNTTLREEFELDLYLQSDAERIKTCNGWTCGESIKDMNSTMAYTRREVVIWGDSVKLRYGKDRGDNPWLWSYMERYTTDMAKIFHGFRIDNCHNTPLPVGVEMLKCARRIRPNLYVVAELFTGSESEDCRIINAMGITSCIRELSQAHTPRHLGELIYHYGESTPCGTFDMTYQLTSGIVATRLIPTRPHAMLLDMTHDNPCPFEQHPVVNVLALAGAKCSAKCSIGSTRGFDELVPHHIHVVTEQRRYLKHGHSNDPQLKDAKRALLELHQRLESFTETFVDQATEDVIIVTRHDPVSCEKVLVVIATKWSESSHSSPSHNVSLPGDSAKVLLEIDINSHNSTFDKHEEFISGLEGVEVNIRKEPLKSHSVTINEIGSSQNITFHLTPGCVIAVEVSPPKPQWHAMANFNKFLDIRHKLFDTFYKSCSDLSLHDLNHIMYRCQSEEQAAGCGGVYHIPEYGDLTYAGVVGFYHVLEEIEKSNDTGHPLCRNLCGGWWMMEYVCSRLKSYQLGERVRDVFNFVKDVPDYMRAKVFEFIVSALYSTCLRRISDLIPDFSKKSWFHKQLILTSVQLVGCVGRTGIHMDSKSQSAGISPVSMSAGLPHFSHGFMRCWGRDTFIALPGLLISTGRLRDARDLIIGFARTLRYGLIPNLLSEGGEKPRYNCRDAVWWWCRAVQLLYEKFPDIIKERVDRLYNSDDSKMYSNVFRCTVLDVVYEVLNRHASGISFVEENAGRDLDEHLKFEGFTVTAGIDLKTGFVWGGSKSNCGTWMDKVGSSDHAGNRGLPATPRDGSAIELVGLSYQTLRWVQGLFDSRVTETQHVLVKNSSGYKTKIPFKTLITSIEDNFEKYFWDKAGNYYRDTVPVGKLPEEDVSEFRPNQAVTMVVAPQLFDKTRHSLALRKMGQLLAGTLGMKTLSPDDSNYRPFYDTTNNSDDYHTAHGFNYHQGPEWVWCMGFYLRAKLHFELDGGVRDAVFYESVLAPHRVMIAESSYRGLTELTNEDGEFCAGSCPTQAWSSGTILELLHDIENSS